MASEIHGLATEEELDDEARDILLETVATQAAEIAGLRDEVLVWHKQAQEDLTRAEKAEAENARLVEENNVWSSYASYEDRRLFPGRLANFRTQKDKPHG